MENFCGFCDSVLIQDGEVWICEKCKIITFNKGLNNEVIKDEILNYIKAIQGKIEARSDLHNLEQKYINGEELSYDEGKIREFCTEFQSICADIKLRLNGDYKNKQFRKVLYRLFQLSKCEKIL